VGSTGKAPPAKLALNTGKVYVAVLMVLPTSKALAMASISALLLASRAFLWVEVKIVRPITERIAIIEITTRSSTRVKPFLFVWGSWYFIGYCELDLQ